MVSGPLSGNVNTTRGVIRLDAQFRRAITEAARAQAALVDMARGIEAAIDDAEKSINGFNAAIGRMGAQAKAAAQLQKQRAREIATNERQIQRNIQQTQRVRQRAFTDSTRQMAAEARSAVSLERQKLQAIRNTERERRREFEQSKRAARDLQQTLIGLSVAAGLITREAASAADMLTRFEASFKAILGTEERVAELMEIIERSTFKFGLNLDETRQLARGLLPILGSNLEVIERFVEQAARLGTLPSTGGGVAALRAIQELAAGQTRSIIQLFNIPPDVVNQAKAQFNDIGDQLDFILNTVGATEEAALAMANSFEASSNRIRNSLRNLLGRAIIPLREEIVGPLARGVANFFDLISREAPILTTVAISMVALTAVLGPLALALSLVAQAYAVMARQALIAGAATRAARIGAAGLVAAGAVEGGVFIARQAGIKSVEGQSQTEALQTLFNGIKQILAIIIAFLGNLVQSMGELFASIQIVVGIALDMVDNAFGALGDILFNAGVALRQGFALILLALADFLEGLNVTILGRNIAVPGSESAAASVRGFATGLVGDRQSRDVRGLGQTDAQRQATAERALNLSGAFNELAASMGEVAVSLFESGEVAQDSAKEIIQVARTRADILADIAQAELSLRQEEANAVLELTRRFEQRRTRFIEDQARARLQAETRFMARRTRLFEDFQRDLARLRLDFFMEERDLVLEFNERRIEEERKTHDAIAKVIRDSRIKVLEAAASLDARAVFNEQRRRAERIRELRNEQTEEQTERSAELAKRLAQLREEFELTTTARRAQFQVDLTNMTLQFQAQQVVRAQNAAVRLARMQEDFQREVFELSVSFAQKRQAATILLREELKDFDIRVLNQKALARKIDIINLGMSQAAVSAFTNFWTTITAVMNASAAGTPAVNTSSIFNQIRTTIAGRPRPAPLFQTGGPIRRSGLIQADEGEFMLAKDTATIIRRMMGGNITQPGIAAAVAGGGGTQTQNITLQSNGPLIVGDVGSLSEDELRVMVKDALMELFVTGDIK